MRLPYRKRTLQGAERICLVRTGGSTLDVEEELASLDFISEILSEVPRNIS